MRDICFIDKTFDSTQSQNYHLSVQICSEGVFFSILDLTKGKYILLVGYQFFVKRPRFLLKQIKDIFEKEEITGLGYNSVEILYATNVFTLVPSPFYEGEDAVRFIQFNHSSENGFVLKTDNFLITKAWCLFQMPENLNEYINDKFPKAVIHHNLYPLVENSLRANLNYGSRKQFHLNFFKDSFEMAVIDGSKLLQCNIFNFKNERDILYYVLYCFDQLKLSQEETEVLIHGQLPQVSPVYHLLKKYIRKTAFAQLENTFQYSYTFNHLPAHYFTSLINLYKCE